MEAYAPELERAAVLLRSKPGRVTEQNIKRIGTRNHLEVFEDSTEAKGKRLSFSGSIVVIDIDFDSEGAVQSAHVALATQIPENAKHSFMAAINHPEAHLMEALHRPRLDEFAGMISFVARCDRLSTRNVDIFRALDGISAALWTRNVPDLVVNPEGHLGVALQYHRNHLALVDVVAGSRPEFAVRINDWVDAEGEWTSAELGEPDADDARAELVLTLEPPVLMCEDAALRLKAETTNFHQDRRQTVSYKLRRHPSQGDQVDLYKVDVATCFSDRLVRVNQIPLQGPSQIPDLVDELRQTAIVEELVQKLLNKPTEPDTSEAPTDLSVADALELPRMNPGYSGIRASVILCNDMESSAENRTRRLDIALSTGTFSVLVPLGAPVKLEYDGEYDYMNKLINAGELALAISFAAGAAEVNMDTS